MKHVAGFPNSAGTRITTVESRKSGVTAAEHIRTRAGSIVNSTVGIVRVPRIAS